MDNQYDILEPLKETTEQYIKAAIELSKLKILETITNVITSLVSKIAVVLIFSMFLLILSIGIAFMLGDNIGKTYYGFFIVAGFYLMAGAIFHFFLYKWIKEPVSNLIINKALQENNNAEHTII